MLRRTLSEGGEVPDHFSRPEVLAILKEYYATLADRVDVPLHKHAGGDR
jgi:sulfate adenylyltransferase